ncbi:FAD binding domain-containing protein [Streptomyces sp. NPDC058297]|uniref:FAD binding domain-containing protein n=1 Tax=Streptomyces sp. NPDC058297 TaxID=3346433 RepID=UPI0036DFC4FF
MKTSDAPAAPQVRRPTTVEELAALVATNPGVTVLGGGTLEVPRWADPSVRPARVVLLNDVPELTVVDTGLCGAGVTLARAAGHTRLPLALRRAARSIAGPALRSTATVGGNVAGVSPGCLAVALLSLGAEAEVLQRDGSRTWRELARLLQGPNQDGYVILAFRWPGTPEASSFRKVTQSAGGGVPLVTVSVSVSGFNGERKLWRAAVGGRGFLPQRLPELEHQLAADPNAKSLPERLVGPQDIEFRSIGDEGARRFRVALIERQVRAAVLSIWE